MRNPIHVLKSLEEKASVSNNKYERLYRNLYNPEFYLLAYANIAKSQGSMTQGVDGQTLDNMSLPRINRIIESIRNRTYQPKPAKRKYIYNTGSRTGLIDSLREMRGELSPEETELRELTDSALTKLCAMTDEKFAELELYPDFDQ